MHFLTERSFIGSIVWLTIVRSSVCVSCPKQCQCDDNNLSAVCKSASKDSRITDIPAGQFNPNTKNLVLSENFIKILKNETFLKSTLLELESLDLSRNKISKIEVLSLKYLKKLGSLKLSGNRITRIPPELFQDNEYLLRLYLNNNPHLQLPAIGFDLPHLIILDLSDCNLEILPADFFKNMISMVYLFLANNKIKTIDIIQLRPLINLTFVDLNGNQLSELQPEMFNMSKRPAFSVAINDWECNCDMKSVLNEHKGEVEGLILLCSHPIEVANQMFTAELADSLDCNSTTYAAAAAVIPHTELGPTYTNTSVNSFSLSNKSLLAIVMIAVLVMLQC